MYMVCYYLYKKTVYVAIHSYCWNMFPKELVTQTL